MSLATMSPPALHPDGLRSVPFVANYLSVSRSKVYQMMDAGDLSYVKLGKSRRIPWAAVLKLVEESTVAR